jgi:hypothetical protein
MTALGRRDPVRKARGRRADGKEEKIEIESDASALP